MKPLTSKVASSHGWALLLLLFLGAGLLVSACGDGGGPTPTTPAPPAPPPPPPAPEPPATPTGLMVSATTENSITWTWNAVAGASAYAVQISLDETFGDDDTTALALTPTYTVADLPPSTTVYLRVAAGVGTSLEDALLSEWSAHVTGMTGMPPPAPEPPATPTGLMVSATTENSITWTWNAVAGASAYAVQISLDETFGDDDTTTLALTPTYTVADLPSSTTVYLRVATGVGTSLEDALLSEWSTHLAGMTAGAEAEDRAALVALYEAMDGPNWRNSENWLTDAPLEDWYGVETDASGRVATLYLVENKLAGSIPSEFSRLSRLRRLTLWGNQIEDISALAGLTNLTGLNISQNNITDISALAGLTNLIDVSVGDANIQDISPLAGLTNLTHLKVLAANLQDEDVWLLSGLTNLRRLALSHNRIGDISALAELTGLTGLTLWDNQIEDISALAGLTNLEELSLGKNNITYISALAGLTNLTELFLNDGNITDVSPLSRLTNLTFLNLSANNITDISPLSGLVNLRELNLAANNITDISPLSSLTNLEDLDLRGNPYETLSTGDFDIELVLLDDFTESQKSVLQYAARRWMAVIAEDLPDYEFSEGWSGVCGSQSVEISAGDRIDDLRIYVKKERLSVGTLGFGGPRVVREATHLPVVGCMGLELSHANLLITGLHEIGHVLGIGALWTELGYFQNPDGDQHFNGPQAIAAFDAAGGRDYAGAKVPVEGGHWRGSVFGDELMTPSGTGALSAITVQSLADLGYVVDITQADPFTLPAAGVSVPHPGGAESSSSTLPASARDEPGSCPPW